MEQTSKLVSFINRDRASNVATRVRIAGTSRERKQGLMGVSDFEEGQGLWIVPCEAIHTFGMKIALDSIFLDKKLRVKSLKTDLQPRRVAICLKAYSVLELPAGTIAKSGTRIGDQLEAIGTR